MCYVCYTVINKCKNDLNRPLRFLPAFETSHELFLGDSEAPLVSAPLPLAAARSSEEHKHDNHFKILDWLCITGCEKYLNVCLFIDSPPKLLEQPG